MPSTVYKGDVAEVSFAPETSLTIKHTDATITVQSHTGNTTLLRLSGGTTNHIQKANNLRFPVNMLVGSQVVFETGTGLVDADGANVGNDNSVGSMGLRPPSCVLNQPQAGNCSPVA